MRIPKLNRVGRLLIGLLGPAIVGSFIIVVYVFVLDGIKNGLSIETFPILLEGFVLFLVAGFFFIGLQSLVYTTVMEFIVRPRARPRNAYLVVSCMLGAASGLVVDVIFDDPPFFVIFGTIVGLLTGLILYDKDMQSSHNKRMQPGADTLRR
jgi:hypothetical protein